MDHPRNTYLCPKQRNTCTKQRVHSKKQSSEKACLTGVTVMRMCITQEHPRTMLQTRYTVFAQSDTTATIYFIYQFCVASIREWHLFRSANPFADVEESEVA